MRLVQGRRGWLVGGFVAYLLIAIGLAATRGAGAAQRDLAPGLAAFTKPTTSSPIALSANNELLWVVNPDSDTVSVFRTSDNSKVIGDIRVGDEPQSIALHPDNTFAYVANAAGNSVTVIRITNANPNSFLAAPDTNVGARGEITTGAEPWNVVISPDGKRVFVANSAQDTISVLRTDTNPNTLVGAFDIRSSPCNDQTGDNVGDPAYHFQPRGLAVTLDNTRLYVTRFFSFTGGAAPKQATDNGKQGVVCRLTINTSATTIGTSLTAATKLTLAPQITGFKIDTNADGTPDTDTSAYPNQMQSIVIRGSRAYLPNIAASPTGPLKFNVDTQAFVNSISGIGSSEADAGALNLHLGARTPEAGKEKLFFANPWAIAFTNQSGSGSAYVASAGSDLLVKLNVDAAGVLSFTGGAATTRYIDLNDPADAATNGGNAGKNPLGIVICDSGACAGRAYVMNYVSRNISVVDTATDAVVTVKRTNDLPPPGTQEEQLHVGKEVFFSSRGVFDNGSKNRLSSEGWQNCASCHFNGWTDSVVWSFNAGPRKSVPLNGTWSPHNPDDQRVLNYSAIFDEVQDFELNIRNVSGPGPLAGALDPNHGLIIPDSTALTDIVAFNKANAGRPQQTITLPGSTTPWPALDAMNEWVRFAIRTPNGALDSSEVVGGINAADVTAGRRLFFRAGCQTCHGGTKWTISNKDFASPPAATTIATETNPAAPVGVTPIGAQFLFEKLRDVGTFGFNTAGIGAAEKTQDNKDALGKDHNLDGKGNGFNIPSLLGIWSLPPYYHNGGCETLACVLANQTHRTKGLRPGRTDLSPSQQAQVVAFLQTLDAQTAFPNNLYINRHDIFLDPPKVIRGTQATVGVNVSLFGTKTDLTDLLNGANLTVKFSGPGLSAEVPITAADFNQDFGQARVTTTWNVPNSTGRVEITVEVDSGLLVDEANERDNKATRRVRIFGPAADNTPPVVVPGSVSISDDDPFNPNDPLTTSRDVQIRFQATDSGGSGIDAACVVRYSYNARQRRWVEEECKFEAITPDGGSGDTFTIDARLPDKPGTAYAFVWVKDKAGNISKKPELDVISFIPSNQNINLERNDTRIFRISLDAGQSIQLTFTPSIGDIDVLVFKNGSFQSASANSGTAPESVTLTADANDTLFQVEVRAVVNSRFSVNASAPGVRPAARAPAAIGPAAVIPTPLVSGPPAAQAAIESAPDIFVPVAVR